MRLALSDIKKTFAHRDGQAYVIPRLLRPRELLSALESLIALHESFVGHERAGFPTERAAELVGDYRLARCLVACLGEWYEWRSPPWPGAASEREQGALAALGISSPTSLRLALYDHVNAAGGGYLPTASREHALDAFAAALSIARTTLDQLLSLDAEALAVLSRLPHGPPAVSELVQRYNQRAVEALLANASAVEWVLPPAAAYGSGGGLGTLVKRICFLARRMGVQYDVAFDERASADETHDASGESTLAQVAEAPALYAASPPTGQHMLAAEGVDRAALPVVVTLYGPQEVTATPAQYGERLAQLCRVLLGYRRADPAAGAAVLAGGSLSGRAHVYVQGRPMLFALDERLLRLLRTPIGPDILESAPVSFDSSLEQRLHADFSKLERSGQAAGWRLEREPEPLLVEDTILVPDFALTRGSRRVYLEIAGYWRPEYRDRKARKLARLRGTVSLALAAPEAARPAFEGLASSVPVLWYKDRVSAHALLALLERHYDDSAQRLASLDLAATQREIAQRGCVPGPEAMTMLRCYSRNEVALAMDLLERSARDANEAPPAWVDGIGLCASAWLDALVSSLRTEVEHSPGCRASLDALTQTLVKRSPPLPQLGVQEVETLARLAGLSVDRRSMFEASVSLPGAARELDPSADRSVAPAGGPVAAKARRAQPRKGAGRRQTGTTTDTQPLFADHEHAGGD